MVDRMTFGARHGREPGALPGKPRIVFMWDNFGPYHVDRVAAARIALAATHQVIGLEIASNTAIYGWDSPSADGRVTLFPGASYEKIPLLRRSWALLRACARLKAEHYFFCHYERFEVLVAALWMRLRGHQVTAMFDSKFDDKQRYMLREWLKSLFLLPYRHALVGSARSREYFVFLGFRREDVHLGYDTVSLERIRSLSRTATAAAVVPYHQRHFIIVARFVAKKNLGMALDAYRQYRALAGAAARELHLCGSGELEADLRKLVEDREIGGVVFRGFLQSPDIAKALAASLTLILPSSEEQWGLVVNEAIAVGVPILCSDNVGARDLLVRSAIDGYLFEPDNPEGLARMMDRIGRSETEWRQLSEGTARFAPFAGTEMFTQSVARIVGLAQTGPAGIS